MIPITAKICAWVQTILKEESAAAQPYQPHSKAGTIAAIARQLVARSTKVRVHPVGTLLAKLDGPSMIGFGRRRMLMQQVYEVHGNPIASDVKTDHGIVLMTAVKLSLGKFTGPFQTYSFEFIG